MRKNESVSNLLTIKAEQVRTGAEMLISKTKDWQIIQQFLCNRVKDLKLTEEQEKKLSRYQFIYNQFSSGKYTRQEIVSQVTKLMNVDQRQAYEDISCTQEIFNSVLNVNKIFEAKLELDIAKSMRQKCIDGGDMKTAAMIQKNIIALNALLPEEEENTADLFEGHEVEAVFDPRLLGSPAVDMKEVLAAVNAKRKVKINTDMFEELNEESAE